MSKKLGLVPRLIIAIIVGILIGQFLPLWFVRIFKTFSTFFGQYCIKNKIMDYNYILDLIRKL